VSTTAETRAQETWGTFEGLREHLFEQFQDTPYRDETGLTCAELATEVDAFLEANSHHPRVLQKAHVYRIVTTKGRIAIDPADPFVDKLDHGKLPRRLSESWLEEAIVGPLAEPAAWIHTAYDVGHAGGPRGGLDRGHVAPGWDRMLRHGLSGLLEEARRGREGLGEEATAEQRAFYEAVEIVLEATIELAGRFSRLASVMKDEYPEHRERLELIARTCAHVPAHGPGTFHEAIQFIWLMHELIEMEGENVRSMGQFDRTLYPYYRADIASGRLTPAQARELIKFFWFKYYSRTRGRDNGKNFVFGGQYPDGTEITNELTYLALEAYDELNTPDPKLSVRFLPDTSLRLYRRVADLIRRGHNSFVLINDVPAVEALVRLGVPPEDARLYLPIGCYEPAVEGKEIGCTMNLTVNLAKPVELALFDGVDPLSGQRVGPQTGDARGFDSFSRLWDAYLRQLDHFLERANDCIQAAETEWPRINPSPLLASSIEDCLARGKDVGQGGPHYNSVGYVGAGLANAADSLLALEQAVFQEARFSMGEVIDALRSDFAGKEAMRRYLLNRIPKWGNNNPVADAMAEHVADHFCEKVHTLSNARGGRCRASLFTLAFAWNGGKRTGALPDGRRAGESLAPGMGATNGRDRNGVTALCSSVAKIDAAQLPNGAVLDVSFHPSAVAGERGLEAFSAFIRSFFRQGGYALQFNVYDVETLRDAQKNPDRYATLQIRLTGWSVYFNSLTPQEQELFIQRTTHGL
jgi:formate C-acetyltransferase